MADNEPPTKRRRITKSEDEESAKEKEQEENNKQEKEQNPKEQEENGQQEQKENQDAKMKEGEKEEEEDKKGGDDGSHISRLLERCVRSKGEKQDDTIAIMPYPIELEGGKPNAFQLACSDGKMVQTLIDSGVSPTAQAKHSYLNYHFYTPIMLAAREGFPEAIRVLLDNGASPSVSLRERETEDEFAYLMKGAQPLHACVYEAQEASEKDIVTMVGYLLGAGASPLIKDILGNTPLKLAIQNRHFEAAKLMLERVLSLNGTYSDICDGNLPDREAFLNGSANSDKDWDDGYTSEDIEDFLDEYDVVDDLDYHNFIPLLHLAAKMGAVEIIDMLASLPGCDVNERATHREATPLHFACWGDRQGYLYQMGAEKVKRLFTQTVAKLLDLGADPTLVDWEKHSPLHWLDEHSTFFNPENSILHEFGRRGGLAAQVLKSFEKELLEKPGVRKEFLEFVKEAVSSTETSLVKPAKKEDVTSDPGNNK
eukprot:CAMPEP_0201475884 /NCGR_PEP_ID=MMETSP0151_2-20130828/1213_1 /ASSEMBLY_ACC=CAM_ASM_000257 /TAXON_ID=200890 /ORGANISM="Paramoeba atlantica, Strain 621/1 / CCAP 1560/9" /LENGTH=482 /DNA_ID=CAMNT_0047856095 /DNA_START=14 /DNA_END=1462 /DNA_ORIENTATION=+